MWNFDKGGFLQDLLHDLKYNQLSGVGIDLGKALGTAMRKRKLLSKQKWLIIPVPLHQKRKRKEDITKREKLR